MRVAAVQQCRRHWSRVYDRRSELDSWPAQHTVVREQGRGGEGREGEALGGEGRRRGTLHWPSRSTTSFVVLHITSVQ